VSGRFPRGGAAGVAAGEGFTAAAVAAGVGHALGGALPASGSSPSGGGAGASWKGEELCSMGPGEGVGTLQPSPAAAAGVIPLRFGVLRGLTRGTDAAAGTDGLGWGSPDADGGALMACMVPGVLPATDAGEPNANPAAAGCCASAEEIASGLLTAIDRARGWHGSSEIRISLLHCRHVRNVKEHPLHQSASSLPS
jgi:hypothetical protein